MAKTKDTKKTAPKSKKGPGKTGPGKKGGGPSKDESKLGKVVNRGMDPNRNVGGGGSFAPKAKLKAGESGDYQFLVAPGDPAIVEIEEHQWKEKGDWHYVPCLTSLGFKKCPLCEDSDPDVAGTSYKVYLPVWDFQQKKAVLLAGPKTLRRLIIDRWEKNKKDFLNRTWSLSRFKESPWWDMDRGERKALNDKKRKEITDLPDAEAHVMSEARQFFGKKLDKMMGGGKVKDDKPTALDDEPYTKKNLKGLGKKKLVKIATAFGCKKPDKLDESDLIAFILKKQD